MGIRRLCGIAVLLAAVSADAAQTQVLSHREQYPLRKSWLEKRFALEEDAGLLPSGWQWVDGRQEKFYLIR